MISTVLAQWKKDGTKMLGTMQIIVSGLMVVDDLIPKDQFKYWAAANVILGALTIKRGYTNSQTNQ